MTCVWINRVTADIVSTTPVAESMSPDGCWKAVVDETIVEGWAVTFITADVHLVAMHDAGAAADLTSGRDPSGSVDILGVDTGGHDEERPRIAWLGPDLLQVTVANFSFPRIFRREYRGVRVQVRVDPDDPAARVEWLKTLDRRLHSDDGR